MNLDLLLRIVSAGYLLGSIPTGYLTGRAKGIDIRKHGSGNIGATNVSRTLGKKYGIFVFVCDALKGLIAVRFGIYLSQHMAWNVVTTPDSISIHMMPSAIAGIIGAFACILGHNFPVWLKFKGGKGVATSLGVIIGLVPFAAAIAFALWVAILFASGYVSLASILATISVPVTVAFTAREHDRMPLLIFTSVATLLIVVRHKENIKRLLNGTESSFKKPK